MFTMSVEEYFEGLGVVHSEDDCPVCDDLGPSKPRTSPVGLLKRFWATSWAPWLLVAVVLLVAYFVAIHEIYNIVGGMS